MSMMWVASITHHQGPPRGWVASAEDGYNVAIVCQRLDEGWSPQYGIRRDPEAVLNLPPCFVLDEHAEHALEQAFLRELGRIN